eukprot:TRINITY_DN11020_c0_g1_i1.p2 TRINITY_DN11020_c0_g1~~TRINITY_DN11020_c0_g1_i1.p2  ORF type:complete len:495 (+),score=141.99 TRINITY_DN11020_c0_g1_i1:57-1541(+)
MRRTCVLRALPDAQSPHTKASGATFVAPEHGWGHQNIKTRLSPVIQNKIFNTEPFVMEYDRSRMRAFLENRHHFFMYTRKIPEFWKNHRLYYKLGESLGEWREARIRSRIEELFMNDACQCTQHEAFEVKRVADKLVTLIKDGSKSSRRIVQEFFEVKNWYGGRESRNINNLGDAGDMRAMYKALDDFPQRFRQRHGNYARMTVTHTHMDRVRGRFIDPDINKLIGKVHQRLCIVEMRDRDLSLFHRGQLITGDKGEDVWDHENDRPLLDTHRGFHEQPLGVQVDEKLQEQEDREKEMRGDMHPFVTDPKAYIYTQVDEEMDQDSAPRDHSREMLTRVSGQKYLRGRLGASKEEADEQYPFELDDIEQYIRRVRYDSTKKQMYKDDNFYKMFPTIQDPCWIEKIYRPYMRLSEDRQLQVWKLLENINIHNMGSVLLTEGLPPPKKLEKLVFEDHQRRTWRKKLEYLETFPHNDPRDREVLAPSQQDALSGKLSD